jgi:hypothetical protein
MPKLVVHCAVYGDVDVRMPIAVDLRERANEV